MTTKVRTTGYEETKQGIDDSLKRFNHDYFDLILIHWPMEDDFGTYRALEEAYQEGKTRAIGLSNLNAAQVQAIIDNFTVAPALDQIETHLLWQQKKMHAYLTSKGIAHESYSPLGEGQPEFLENPTLVEMAKLYKVTPAQLTLRFMDQENIIVIPKTLDPKQMAENLDLFNFTITEKDMKILESLDEKKPLDG